MDKKIIDKLAFIEIKDRKLLVTLTRGRDRWYIPGGKREAGESDQQALIREIKEELSVDLDLQSLKIYRIFEAQAHGQPEGVIVRMTCYTGSYKGVLTALAEIERFDFFAFGQRAQTSTVDNLIFTDLHDKGFID